MRMTAMFAKSAIGPHARADTALSVNHQRGMRLEGGSPYPASISKGASIRRLSAWMKLAASQPSTTR